MKCVVGRFLRVVKDALAVVPRARTILDAGCGEGFISRRIACLRPGATVFALDVDPLVLRDVAANGPASVIPVCGSIYRLPFRDRQFDVVVRLEVLEHLEEPEKGLKEVVRVAD